jgi:hypothetical protein
MELLETIMELLDVVVTLRSDIGDLDDQWESPLIDCRIETGCYQLLQRVEKKLEEYMYMVGNEPNAPPTLGRRDI